MANAPWPAVPIVSRWHMATNGATMHQRVNLPTKSRDLGPPVSEDTTFGIRELPHFTALISAKQAYVVLVVPEIKTYMPFPTERVISGKNNEATVRGAGNRNAPVPPRARYAPTRYRPTPPEIDTN